MSTAETRTHYARELALDWCRLHTPELPDMLRELITMMVEAEDEVAMQSNADRSAFLDRVKAHGIAVGFMPPDDELVVTEEGPFGVSGVAFRSPSQILGMPQQPYPSRPPESDDGA